MKKQTTLTYILSIAIGIVCFIPISKAHFAFNGEPIISPWFLYFYARWISFSFSSAVILYLPLFLLATFILMSFPLTQFFIISGKNKESIFFCGCTIFGLFFATFFYFNFIYLAALLIATINEILLVKINKNNGLVPLGKPYMIISSIFSSLAFIEVVGYLIYVLYFLQH